MKLASRISFVLFIVLGFSSRAFAVFFTKDLFLGVNDTDVKVLQQVLNSNPQTSVAIIGPGSAGNETSYFGLKTRDAVIKFQELYRDQILSPLGLVRGTGFAGVSTRKVLETVLSKQNTSTPKTTLKTATSTSAVVTNQNTSTNTSDLSTIFKSAQTLNPDLSQYYSSSTLKTFDTLFAPTTTDYYASTYGSSYGWLSSSSTVEFLNNFNLEPNYFLGDNWKKYPHIFSVTPNEASPGDSVLISGINLDDSSLVLTLNNQEMTFKRISSTEFTFTVPANFAYGNFDLSFQKNNTRFQKNPTTLLVKKKNAPTPIITSVTNTNKSNNISILDSLIIKGKNFDSDNEISTTFGIIPHVSSPDGTTITLSLSDAPLLIYIVQGLKSGGQTDFAHTSPVMFFVKNSNGASVPFGPINIKI